MESVSEVKVNLAVTTLGPLHDDRELLVVTCYLRQSWYDPRLSYQQFINLNMSRLDLNWIFLKTIWKPDTYLLRKKLHLICLRKIMNPHLPLKKTEKGAPFMF